MDVLNDILDTLNLRGVLYFRTDFSGKWGVTVPQLEQAARFHYVLDGQCTVKLGNNYPLTLAKGDLILIPRGKSHILSDQITDTAPSLERLLEETQYDGNGVLVMSAEDDSAKTRLLCGHMSFNKWAEHPLLTALPDYILVTRDVRQKHIVLDQILQLTTQQIFLDAPGLNASIRRLSEIMFLELLRIATDESAEMSAVIQGFLHPNIGKSLQLIHSDPKTNWTVERLAKEVGMSRSRFAALFRELVGEGPIAYLLNWRLQKAIFMLSSTTLTIQQIAHGSGYASAAAFTRAFGEKFDMPPSQYRQHIY